MSYTTAGGGGWRVQTRSGWGGELAADGRLLLLPGQPSKRCCQPCCPPARAARAGQPASHPRTPCSAGASSWPRHQCGRTQCASQTAQTWQTTRLQAAGQGAGGGQGSPLPRRRSEVAEARRSGRAACRMHASQRSTLHHAHEACNAEVSIPGARASDWCGGTVPHPYHRGCGTSPASCRASAASPRDLPRSAGGRGTGQ